MEQVKNKETNNEQIVNAYNKARERIKEITLAGRPLEAMQLSCFMKGPRNQIRAERTLAAQYETMLECRCKRAPVCERLQGRGDTGKMRPSPAALLLVLGSPISVGGCPFS